MQNKYLSALKTSYANFGFSREALDRVASQRVKTIANEDEIDADVASHDTLLLLMKEMQGAADILRTNGARIQKELDNLKQTPPQQTINQPENPYAKEFADMKDMMAKVMGKFAENEKKARTEAILAQTHEVMKKSGCTNDFIRQYTLRNIEVNDGDTAETIAARCKNAYDQNCKAAFGEGYVPPIGNNNGGGEMDQAEVTRILQERGLLPKSK